jgi:rhodanese-related sulfurtransferase
MRQISARELSDWLAASLADAGRAKPFLLDVREPWEFDNASIAGSTLMPMASVPLRLDELPRDAELVCICHHGARSMQVAMFLEGRGFEQVTNLTGGIDAWSRDVDPTVPRY